MEQKTNKTITITEVDFKEAVFNTNLKFRKMLEEKDKTEGLEDSVTNVLMGLQNIIFAGMLADELFGKNVSSEDTENTEPTINA